ncbi:uncharacterized protein E0L32_003245 [Thyridium curvatum]|uniref:ORC6 first cyclin-like domain-containing protein n=1 Tax=Thyridium curvatum TaxID=1093900 RepID=A0A507BB46_9PEZI|nr:uncharacterized protein E0L32_003245 [Thyridium curvatum]TPX17127.1 hypothetical protein E0L32_003245 [Thyridium curvatum]
MNRTIEQTLLSLLPTQNAVLPPTLVDLASSLLVQSRHRASTLKAEEEIARTYACAHLACDRLKTSLNLPPIDPRPPIQPRIYKRLYNHLDNILPSSSLNTSRNGRVRTPSSKVLEAQSSPFSRPSASKGTPSKGKSLAQFRNPAVSRNATPSSIKSHRVSGGGSPNALPVWVRPTARFVCKELDHVHLGPTVMAGMQAIYAPQGHRTDDQWVHTHLTELLGSIYFYVAKQADDIEEYDRDQYKAAENAIIDALNKARHALVGSKNTEEGPSAWEGWSDVRAKQLQKALVMVSDRKWLESDWFRDIANIHGKVDGDRRDESRDRFPEEGSVQLRGADTMFQDRYDFLSEARRNESKLWKEEIMRRIEELEKATSEPMDIDP